MTDLKVKKSAVQLSSTWKVSKSHVGIYTGGKVQLFNDMHHMACQFNDTVKVMNLETASVLYSIKDLDRTMSAERVVSFVVHPNGNEMVTASQNGLLRHWNLSDRKCIRAWKSGHTSPILSMAFDSTGTLVATGGSDKTVQVWDVRKGYATHHFRGHTSIVQYVEFHPDPRHLLLFSFSDDCSIRVWDLNRHKCAATLTEHLSPATCMVFSPDGQTLVTGGRDGVMVFFALQDFKVLKTVPVYEVLEGMCAVPDRTLVENGNAHTQQKLARSFCFATAGRRGVVKIWQFGIDRAINDVTLDHAGITAQVLALDKKEKKLHKKKRSKLGSSTKQVSSALSNSNGKLVCRLLLEEPHPLGDPNANGAAADAGSAAMTTSALMRQRQQQAEHEAQKPARKRKRGKNQRKKARGSLADAGHGTAAKAGYSGIFLLDPDKLIVLSHDHNFHFKNLRSPQLSQTRQVMGFNDEILDLKCIPDIEHSENPRHRLVMVTNSEHVRVTDLATFDTRLLMGHTAMALAVAVSPDASLIATTSKDATCRIWSTCTQSNDQKMRCVAICRGHTAAVGGVAFPNNANVSLRASGPAFIATVSADMSTKLWDLRPVLLKLSTKRPSTSQVRQGKINQLQVSSEEPIELNVLYSVAAHKKDINAISIAPNDQLLATASQDKLIALWQVHARSGDDVELTEVARLQGHRRGVWCARFSPIDKVLASGSGDRTIRIWSVTSYECLQTLEGHSASVLNVCFLRGGVQLMSAGGDGLLKLWTLRNNECVNTFDAHDDKVWALEALPADRKLETDSNADFSSVSSSSVKLITGASDSTLTVWYDATAEVQNEEVGRREEFVRRKQEMLNAYRCGQYAKAMEIAMEIDQPLRLRGLLEKLIAEGTLQQYIEQVEFSPTTLTRLLLYARDWNTNARFCGVAQAVLSFALSSFTFEELRRAVREASASAFHTAEHSTSGRKDIADANVSTSTEGTTAVALQDMVKGLVAYSERHLKRVEKVYQSSFLLEYTLRSMQKLLPQLPKDQQQNHNFVTDKHNDVTKSESKHVVAPSTCPM